MSANGQRLAGRDSDCYHKIQARRTPDGLSTGVISEDISRSTLEALLKYGYNHPVTTPTRSCDRNKDCMENYDQTVRTRVDERHRLLTSKEMETAAKNTIQTHV